MIDQWEELKETIIEMRDNDGTGTQQEVCEFLANYMDVLEKQMKESCEDEYIKVPKKALKYRTAGMVAYNTEWLKKNWQTELKVMGIECEDAISRQAVKDWFCTNYCSEHNKCEHFENGDCNAMVELFAIPPVKPKEPKTIQEKQAESEKYQKAFDDGYENGYAQARFDYKQEPKIGQSFAILPVKPNWIKYSIPRCGEQHYACTSCGYYINFGQWGEVYTKQFKCCPNCGARMVDPQENEEQK